MQHSELRVTLVDPRHASDEVDSPVCRVDFWDMERSHSFEHRIEHAAGIDEVPARDEAYRAGRQMVIRAEYVSGDGTGLLCLHGHEAPDD